jgi:hypothetical protein
LEFEVVLLMTGESFSLPVGWVRITAGVVPWTGLVREWISIGFEVEEGVGKEGWRESGGAECAEVINEDVLDGSAGEMVTLGAVAVGLMVRRWSWLVAACCAAMRASTAAGGESAAAAATDSFPLRAADGGGGTALRLGMLDVV